MNYREFAVECISERICTRNTAYDVRYSYRPLAGIAVVSMSIYLFTYTCSFKFQLSSLIF